jgi:hypothetical protein
MPLFGSSNVVYTQKTFVEMCKRQATFRSLSTEIGERDALYVVGLIFEHFAGAGANAQISVTRAENATYPSTISDIINFELTRIRNKKRYISQLLTDARAGRLKTRLDAATLAEREFYQPNNNLEGKTLNLDKALSWVCKSWHGDGRNIVLAALYQHTFIAPRTDALGKNSSIISGVHKKVAPGAPAFRKPSMMPVSYPSSIGGQHLLKHIFDITANINWPDQGDESWINWALFFMASIVTVQGFTDGNKRAGRMAYSIIMINSGVDFVAPTVALENQLYQM